MFVSPTSPVPVQPEDAVHALARSLPGWQAALARLGLLDRTNPLQLGGVAVSHTLVRLQGLSYQAAQYVSKLLAAEVFARHGPHPDAEAPRPLLVSANVAGVTRTRSMQHPVFQAAFGGAHHFDLEVYDPPTTRVLSGLLLLHDVLFASDTPGAAADPNTLFARQIHGGLYAQPLDIEKALRIAALLGYTHQPSLLLRSICRSA